MEADPLQFLTTENTHLRAQQTRLEAETEALAQELVMRKIDMQKSIEALEEQNHAIAQENKRLQTGVCLSRVGMLTG